MNQESGVGSQGDAGTPDVRDLFTGPVILDDTRRVPGRNLLWDRPGVVLDVKFPDDISTRVIASWEGHARRILGEVGWPDESTLVRRFPGGATLAMSAPIDALLAATEVNEWALLAAQADVVGGEAPALAAAARRLKETIAAEERPRLRALWREAVARGASFRADEAQASVGAGTGSLTWKFEDIPPVEQIDWHRVHDVPTVLITGSNGKTTSTRLLSAVLAETGKTVGMCCTDSVTVGSAAIASGDWAGPGGARMVLQDRRVEIAVLETARGGILRRGLAADHARAAIVTNIAEDHFGEFGVHDLESLAAAKLVVARALVEGGVLVLNADDPVLAEAGPHARSTICWFSLQDDNPLVRAQVARGGRAVWVEQGEIRTAGFGAPASIAQVDEIPITMRGAASYNVANALGVIGAALALGTEPALIRRGLIRFGGSARENPGRLNLFEFGETRAIADFAHNPHGMHALVGMAAGIPAKRRLLILGQAGDRDDASIRDLVRSAWTFHPDRIVLKEMEKYRRGRAVGEVPGLIRDEFIRLGADPDSISVEPSEYDALLASLCWAQPGDLLLLPLHAERDRGLALLEELQRSGWRAGTPPEIRL